MRVLAYILAGIVVAVIVLYFMSNMILEAATNRAIDYITQNVKVASLQYTRPSYESVRLSSYNSITWYGISLDASLTGEKDRRVKKEAGGGVSAKLKEFTISLEDIADRTILVKFRGLSAQRKGAPGKFSKSLGDFGDRVEAGDLEVRVRVDAFSWQGILNPMKTLSEELREFSRTGVTKIPIRFEAKQTFILRGMPFTVKLKMLNEGDEYRLVIDENSLRRLGALGGKIGPTSGDIKIVARNPLRAARLLAISGKAEAASSAAHRINPLVPEDAYRHTLWSYLLTKEFGKEFAKQVTDAHESEADTEERKSGRSFSVSSYQDFNNNAMGRSYAIRGYPESSIVRYVLTDPAIIRDNESDQRYNPADYARYRSRIARRP